MSNWTFMRKIFLSTAMLMHGSVLIAAEAQPQDIENRLSKIEAAKNLSKEKLQKLRTGKKTAEQELTKIDAELADTAKQNRQLELSALTVQEKLLALNASLDELKAKLTADRNTLDDLVAALMMWGKEQPPILLTAAHKTSDAIRSAILMGEITPALDQRARELVADIDKISALRSGIKKEQKNLLSTETMLDQRRKQILQLAREKRDLLKRLELEENTILKQNRKLAKEAKSLRELVEKLLDKGPSAPLLRPKSPALPDFAAPGKQPKTPEPPAAGSIIYVFGQPNNAGEKQRGLTYATRENAQIVAPLGGRVEYAGLFRSYGHIVILNVGKGYLLVLAGMEKLYAKAGQSVFAGEPVGHMSARRQPPPALYFEVRRNGKPVDPRQWMKRDI